LSVATTRPRDRPPQQRAAPRAKRQRSDLLARILVAVPAAIVAIVFIDLGGLAFAVFIAVIGLLCMHELYQLLSRWRPLPLVGFAALIGMVLAARYGTTRAVLEVAVATVPVLVLFVILRPQHAGATVAIAGTLLGVYWIGFAFAHAVLLRQLHHGNGIVIDVLVVTFLGDTAAYIARWPPTSPPTRPSRGCSAGC
jgi:phosphatidate cytidylyltransferase